MISNIIKVLVWGVLAAELSSGAVTLFSEELTIRPSTVSVTETDADADGLFGQPEKNRDESFESIVEPKVNQLIIESFVGFDEVWMALGLVKQTVSEVIDTDGFDKKVNAEIFEEKFILERSR